MNQHSGKRGTNLLWKLLAVLAVFSLVAVACGDDDDTASGDDGAASSDDGSDDGSTGDDGAASSDDGSTGDDGAASSDDGSTGDDGAASSDDGSTGDDGAASSDDGSDGVDLLADGDPCTGLDPQPLAETETVKVARGAIIEAFAQVYLAESEGEFAAENIEIEYVDAGSQPDGLVLLSVGDVDVMPTSPTAGVFNAIQGGTELRIVAPIFIAPEGSKTGIWLSTDLLDGATPEDFDYSNLAGTTIGSSGGPGTPGSFVLYELLQRGGLTFDDVTVEQLGPADNLIALENGAIDGAYLLDPFWVEADNDDYAVSVLPQPSDLSLGATLFGEKLVEERRDIGEAFIRAYARTTCKYLQGDYHADPDVVASLAEALDVPEENLTTAPSLNFDPWLTIPSGVTDTLQEIYALQDVLADPDAPPVAEEQVVDRGFIEAVLGS